MYQSPRTRRLRNDLAALDQLRAQSSVFRFSAEGDPPHRYLISFKGKGLWRDRGKIRILESHRVEIKLGASYPRLIPDIRWITPVYHPNISEIGMVCLGGYGTHWVPSVQLDELCTMLWDMARYFNYDIRSPYNRDAALWVASQTAFLFPTDGRPLRDLRAALGRIPSSSAGQGAGSESPTGANGATKRSESRSSERGSRRWSLNARAWSPSATPASPQEPDVPIQYAWIRQFVEALERRHRPNSDHAPQSTLVRRLVERYGPIFAKDGVPEPNRLTSNVGAVPPPADVHGQPGTGADSDQTRTGNEQADVVLVEPATRLQPEPEPPPLRGDDIIFIE
jgi:ubiquitin-protein ligase